jgi:hypothetical protein
MVDTFGMEFSWSDALESLPDRATLNTEGSCESFPRAIHGPAVGDSRCSRGDHALVSEADTFSRMGMGTIVFVTQPNASVP